MCHRVIRSLAQSVEHRTCNQVALGSTLASSQKVTDNILGQYMNLIIISPHQGVKLVPAGDRSEHNVMNNLTVYSSKVGWSSSLLGRNCTLS